MFMVEIEPGIFSADAIWEVRSLFEENGKGEVSESRHKRQRALIDLSDSLYNAIQDECWMTEETLAKMLDVSKRQIKRAKVYLALCGKIRIKLKQNGHRSNPKHYIYKVEPTSKGVRVVARPLRHIKWEILAGIPINDFKFMTVEDQLDIYIEMNLPFFPVCFPKFEPNGNAYGSCWRKRKCDAIGKHPVVTLSDYDFSDSSTLTKMKLQWEDKDNRLNVGFFTDDFAVIDIDYRHFGDKSLGLIEETYGSLPKGLMVETGGGCHIYVSDVISTTTNLLGYRGIDVRSRGGIIIAPFSTHYTGAQYKWLSVSTPEPLPDALLNEIQEKSPIGTTGAKPSNIIKLPKSFDNFIVEEGKRCDTLFKVACKLRGQGKDEIGILDNLKSFNSQCCVPPVPEYRLRTTAKSACKYPTNIEKELALKP